MLCDFEIAPNWNQKKLDQMKAFVVFEEHDI